MFAHSWLYGRKDSLHYKSEDNSMNNSVNSPEEVPLAYNFYSILSSDPFQMTRAWLPFKIDRLE